MLTLLSTTPRWNENTNWTPSSDANKGVLPGDAPSANFARPAQPETPAAFWDM